MDSHLHEQSEEDMEEYRVILYAGPSNDQFGLTADDDLEEDFRGDLSVEDVEESVRRSLERRSAREEEETREEEMERATEETERGGAAPALHIEFEPTDVSVYVGELLLRSFLAATLACLSALLSTLRFFIILLVVLTQFFVGPFVYYFILALRFLFLSSAQPLETPEPLPIPFGAGEADDFHVDGPEMFFEPALFVELEPVLAPTEAASLGPDILVEEEVNMEWIPYPTPPPTSSEAFTATSSSSSSASTTPGLSTSSSSTPLTSLMSEE
ncbi:hypothetical protein NEUTE1DRAFT_102485 [Neurospora tetrasperma FGSC 2508]|uniref:Transmembrane protein n=1 Tax=Neurospora tetrasperma (strain FGSC 2508 / ATCC MYA-4615 / P0657) TaxID=510951 RepID=F8MS73_NEUT8|nr:uncharacterized protein NEUTE1DRAFT_102485 [Neurospora tetrasperma FGSC 2508]EGO55014.1 hypothetical protein NEUTE1DRAFT_102485 [Neurospora tetrasperma FGSC 2508]EGZ69784.1 hypothetical protein NEUTE2DRAFT_141311 [Neurospora tetrasperma FGSC 2509]